MACASTLSTTTSAVATFSTDSLSSTTVANSVKLAQTNQTKPNQTNPNINRFKLIKPKPTSPDPQPSVSGNVVYYDVPVGFLADHLDEVVESFYDFLTLIMMGYKVQVVPSSAGNRISHRVVDPKTGATVTMKRGPRPSGLTSQVVDEHVFEACFGVGLKFGLKDVEMCTLCNMMMKDGGAFLDAAYEYYLNDFSLAEDLVDDTCDSECESEGNMSCGDSEDVCAIKEVDDVDDANVGCIDDSSCHQLVSEEVLLQEVGEVEADMLSNVADIVTDNNAELFVKIYDVNATNDLNVGVSSVHHLGYDYGVFNAVSHDGFEGIENVSGPYVVASQTREYMGTVLLNVDCYGPLANVCNHLLLLFKKGNERYYFTKPNYDYMPVINFSGKNISCGAYDFDWSNTDFNHSIPLALNSNNLFDVATHEVYIGGGGVGWTSRAENALAHLWNLSGGGTDRDKYVRCVAAMGDDFCVARNNNLTYTTWSCNIEEGSTYVNWSMSTLFYSPYLSRFENADNVTMVPFALHRGALVNYRNKELEIYDDYRILRGVCLPLKRYYGNYSMIDIFDTWSKEISQCDLNHTANRFKNMAIYHNKRSLLSVRDHSYKLFSRRPSWVNDYYFNMDHVIFMDSNAVSAIEYDVNSDVYADDMHYFIAPLLAKRINKEILIMRDAFGPLGFGVMIKGNIITPSHIGDIGIGNPKRLCMHKDAIIHKYDKTDLCVITDSGIDAVDSNLTLRVPMDAELCVLVKFDYVFEGNIHSLQDKSKLVFSEPVLYYKQTDKYGIINRGSHPGDSGAILVSLLDYKIVGFLKGGLLDFPNVSMITNVFEDLIKKVYT
uniref:Uncharacterized protein n=1 Tax=Rhizopus microsporus virga-like virus 1 TaxID=3156536 RepID=A0AAT9H7Z1_9VIRU